MKYIQVYALFLMLVFCSSCGQSQKKLQKENSKSKTNEIITSPVTDELNFHTKYEYADSDGKDIIIQNSWSRGGSYTDLNGKEYARIIFWTRIINATENPLELKIDLPGHSYEVPTLPGKYFKILIPSDTMKFDREPLQDYGMTNIKSFLDNNISNPISLNRTINPKASSGFLVVILLDKGVAGPTRTGLFIKGQNLFYKVARYTGKQGELLVDEKEINCGSINLKNLRLRKKNKNHLIL